MPKKRGPKTDVLEALLKRVDGLEKRLHSEGKNESAIEDEPAGQETSLDRRNSAASSHSHPNLDIAPKNTNPAKQLMSPIEPRYLSAKHCLHSNVRDSS